MKHRNWFRSLHVAKKTGTVFASPATWSKIVKKFKLRRPRVSVYPAKPKVGIRASAPGQIWHLDLSVIKLIDGTRCYIEGVLDNLKAKHRYLYFKKLTSLEVLTGHADSYFQDSNELIPHGALNGATPYEAITGNWTECAKEELSELAANARALHIETNRALNCQACPC